MPEAESPSARTADSFDNTCNRLEKTHATQSERQMPPSRRRLQILNSSLNQKQAMICALCVTFSPPCSILVDTLRPWPNAETCISTPGHRLILRLHHSWALKPRALTLASRRTNPSVKALIGKAGNDLHTPCVIVDLCSISVDTLKPYPPVDVA